MVESKYELYKELHFTRCTLYVLNRDVGYSYSQNLTYWRARGGKDIIYSKVFKAAPQWHRSQEIKVELLTFLASKDCQHCLVCWTLDAVSLQIQGGCTGLQTPRAVAPG